MRTNNNVTRKNVLLLQTANGNMSFAQEGKHSETPILTAESLEGWKTATTQIETLLNPKTLIETFWKRQTRPDGRLLTQTRTTSIQTDIYNTSNNNIAGSALVRLGDTHVLAAVSLLVGQCTTSKMTTAAASSTAASSVARGGDIVVLVSTPDSGGGGGENSRDGQAACLLCQSLLHRILHETIDLEQLLIDTNNISSNNRKKQASSSSKTATNNAATSSGPILAWRLQVTVRVLNSNGNIFDAALLASVAALQQTRLPSTNSLQYDVDFGKVAVDWTRNIDLEKFCTTTSSSRPLQMPLLPVPLSMGTFQISHHRDRDNDNDDDDNDNSTTTATTTRWIVDPTCAEQDVLQNALTVVVNAREPHEILAVEFSMGGSNGAAAAGGGISTTDLGVAVHMATARAQEVQSLFQL